jgi:hypothetical protein
MRRRSGLQGESSSCHPVSKGGIFPGPWGRTTCLCNYQRRSILRRALCLHLMDLELKYASGKLESTGIKPIEKRTYKTTDKEANDLRDDEDGHEHEKFPSAKIFEDSSRHFQADSDVQ